MGAGIASATQRGHPRASRRRRSPRPSSPRPGPHSRGLRAQVEKGRLIPRRRRAASRSSRLPPSWEGFDHCDIIVEAVFEDLDLKKRVFAELDAAARPGAILASNTSTSTSTLSPLRPAVPSSSSATFLPSRPVMKLLEVVRGSSTSAQVLATSMDLARRLNKNRRRLPQRLRLHRQPHVPALPQPGRGHREEGAEPWTVDKALVDWGMPWARSPSATSPVSTSSTASSTSPSSSASAIWWPRLLRIASSIKAASAEVRRRLVRLLRRPQADPRSRRRTATAPLRR